MAEQQPDEPAASGTSTDEAPAVALEHEAVEEALAPAPLNLRVLVADSIEYDPSP